MPEPLATPRMVTGFPINWISAEAALARVSVVRIASAKARAEASEEARVAKSSESLAMIFSMGSGTPMMPVDEGKISLARNWSARAASLQTRWQAVFPAGPVAQLALPELTKTARMRPLEGFEVGAADFDGSGGYTILRENCGRGGTCVCDGQG